MMEQLKTPSIMGNNIYLRFVKASDLDTYYSLLQEPELNRLTGSQSEFTGEEIAVWIEKIGVPQEGRVDFMIVVKGTDQLVGEVVLNEIDPINRSANIRICIQGTQHRGKGYGTEAMIHMIRYGFKTLNLHRIHLGVYDFNPRAIHVYEKLGFQREGIERDSLYQDGEFHDMILMAMLEDEFRFIYGEKSPN
ncbi:GNAT family N-acetyltransferase [Paenibacillus wynnii]|uniref:GNAT family N-acetyltransferase n=1 Tax=Paenibacillus wynnii TaxID=268407 RepID=UPI00278D586D|nr:GNAT family protein [Paenibacillus wynnii]MDQ0192537.1 RimJ/RimL family protein N-acetyltransferase [Paenibacillus wynnii]